MRGWGWEMIKYNVDFLAIYMTIIDVSHFSSIHSNCEYIWLE